MGDDKANDDCTYWEGPGVAWIQAGTQVEICGLIGRPELNGLAGKATAKAPSGRWGVALDDGSPGMAVKDENLRRPREPLPQGAEYSPGDRVIISQLRSGFYLNGSVGTIQGAASAGRWAVKLDTDTRKILAVGARHLGRAPEKISLWQHHVALRRAVAGTFSGDLSALRHVVWSFLRDPTELSLIYPVFEENDLEIRVYGMQTGSCTKSLELPIRDIESDWLLIGLQGPQEAIARTHMHVEDMHKRLGKVVWMQVDGSWTANVVPPRMKNEVPIVIPKKSTSRISAVLLPVGEGWAAVLSVEKGWIARVIASCPSLIELYSAASGEILDDLSLPNACDVNDMSGITATAFRDLLLVSFYRNIEILAVRDHILVHQRSLMRFKSMFGSSNQISFHWDLCAIVSQSVPNSDRGGLVSLYSVSPSCELSPSPKAELTPWRLNLVVEAVLSVDKIFTREFSMRIFVGNEYEIVVRSLANLAAPPLFILCDDLTGRPETMLFARPGVTGEIDRCLASVRRLRDRKRTARDQAQASSEPP